MKWAIVLLVVSVVFASDSLIDSHCGDLENAKLQIGETEVGCGKKYPLDAVSASNIDVTFEGAKADRLYLIAMVDPDAPSHETAHGRSWLHFVNENVQGSDLALGKHGGHTVTEYNAPTPPKGTGYHRYYVFVFEQEGELSLSNPSSRSKFDIDKFAKDNHLTPIAMNMFRTKS